MSRFPSAALAACLVASGVPAVGREGPPAGFFEAHCHRCHDDVSKRGGLDLTSLEFDPADPANIARWVKVYDRVAAGEMPPRKEPRPKASDAAAMTRWLHDELVAAEREAAAREGRTRLRRLTRVEYENTVRDL